MRFSGCLDAALRVPVCTEELHQRLFLSDSRSRKCSCPQDSLWWKRAVNQYPGLDSIQESGCGFQCGRAVKSSGCHIYCGMLINTENDCLPVCNGAYSQRTAFVCFSVWMFVRLWPCEGCVEFIKHVMWTLWGLTWSFMAFCLVPAARRPCTPPHTWSRASGEAFTHLI